MDIETKYRHGLLAPSVSLKVFSEDSPSKLSFFLEVKILNEKRFFRSNIILIVLIYNISEKGSHI